MRTCPSVSGTNSSFSLLSVLKILTAIDLEFVAGPNRNTFRVQIPAAILRKAVKKHNKTPMNFAKPYEDLREFIGALDANDKLYRIHREINKDTELQPLVRWQFRGGIQEAARRGFLFDNV